MMRLHLPAARGYVISIEYSSEMLGKIGNAQINGKSLYGGIRIKILLFDSQYHNTTLPSRWQVGFNEMSKLLYLP